MLFNGAMFTESMLGRRLGTYKVTEVVGAGGMGTVYRGERADEQFHKQVAIKVVVPEGADEAVLLRFRHERETLAGLDHPNIVKLLDGGVTEDGLPYLVMDYVEGVPVDEYCDIKQLSVERRLWLFLDICAALEYAHSCLIIHRDIKPRNVLVTAVGTPKLLDFGIAKMLGGQGGASLAATQKMRALTLECASPEQVTGGSLTVGTDVYALGVLLYQLLAGRWPYAIPAPSEGALAYAICQAKAEPASAAIYRQERWAASSGYASEPLDAGQIATCRGTTPARLRSAIQGDLDAILEKVLEKDPSNRYGSVAELSADIRRHLSARPVSARPQTTTYRLHCFWKRNKVAVAVGVAAAFFAIASVAGVVVQSVRAERERAVAEQRFHEMRELLGTFLFDIHDNIRDVPGTTNARAMLVNKASKYLEWLSEQARQDVNLQLDLADSYIKMAGLKGNPFEMNLGKSREAIAGYQKAQEIAESILKGDPKNLRAQRYLALSNLRRGDVLALVGNRAEAIQRVRAALDLFLKIAALSPKSPEALMDLASAHEVFADLVQSDRVQAIENLQGALDNWRFVLRLEPDSFRARRALGIVRMKVGDVRRVAGDAERALGDYQLASDEIERLWNDTTREELRRVRAIAIGKVAHILNETGDRKSSLERYDRQRLIFEGLVQIDPSDTRAQMDLASSWINIGDTHFALGAAADSLAAYQKSMEILQKLSAADPSNATALSRLATALFSVAYMQAELKQTAEARKHSERALAIAKRLADQPGASPAMLEAYADALLTCRPEQLQNPREALVYAGRAVEKSQGREVKPLATLAQAYFANQDSAKAIETIEKALALLPKDQRTSSRSVLENKLKQYQTPSPPRKTP
jgi:non-specific serine/threonine protein kinase/serine/threonine-protein kinase